MKKMLSVLIVLCMMLGYTPALAQNAAENSTVSSNLRIFDDFWVEVNEGSYTIVGIRDTEDGTIVVPDKLRGYIYGSDNKKEYLSDEEYTLAPEAFKYCDGVYRLEFEKGVETIPRGLCEGMIDLETVILPVSVFAIDNDAFKLCENLVAIDLSRVQYIGRSAFEGCTSLDDVTFSEKLETIESYTFYGCGRLENVAGLHSGIAIGQDAFTGTKVAPFNEVEHFYLAQSLIKNQDDIVGITVDALSWLPEGDDPESEKYDFTTDDKETIKALLDILNSCRYIKTKGTLASDGTTLRITVKYADGKENSEDFKESTVVVDNVKYQLLSEDYWKIADYIKHIKAELVQKSPFNDVPYNSEYYESIKELSELGIMGGYMDGNFKTEATLTRAEAAAIIVRLLNLESEAEKGRTNYTDVPVTHWASGYINVAEANGIINGQGDGTFAPEESVTFEQLVKMLVCALGYEPVALTNGGWANGGYVTAAKSMGLVENGIEIVNMPITRSRAAQLCYDALYIDLMSQSCKTMYQILEGKTILTEYWEIEE